MTIVKPGWQTSEFWVNVAALIIALLTALGIHVTRQDDILVVVSTIAPAIISAVYTWQRTALKQVATTPQDASTNTTKQAVQTATPNSASAI